MPSDSDSVDTQLQAIADEIEAGRKRDLAYDLGMRMYRQQGFIDVKALGEKLESEWTATEPQYLKDQVAAVALGRVQGYETLQKDAMAEVAAAQVKVDRAEDALAKAQDALDNTNNEGRAESHGSAAQQAQELAAAAIDAGGDPIRGGVHEPGEQRRVTIDEVSEAVDQLMSEV